MKQRAYKLPQKANAHENTVRQNRRSFSVLFYAVNCFFFSIALLAASASHVYAQKPLPIKSSVIDSAITIEEKLVELALKGPLYLGSENQNKINEYTLKTAKNAWMNLLTLSINYNDQSFTKSTSPNTYVYPKYYFGFNIPLGTIFSKTSVRSAKEQVELSKHNQEQLARTLRSDVLSKYKQYKTYGELIKLQNEVVVNEQAAVNQIEGKMNDESFSIDVYKNAVKTLNDEKGDMLNLQLQRDIIKLEIERIIGTSLDSVLNP